MKYLIVKCEELHDQYECDVNRTPITMTDSWVEWFNENQPDYLFEAWELVDGEFKCVKEYDLPLEEGMALTWWPNEENADFNFIIIKKYPNTNRYSPVPKEVKKYATKALETNNSLRNCGYISYEYADGFYVYTEYYDNHVCAFF